ncbi:MAG: ATP-binding protein, partial [Thermoprotei archaeon]
MKICALFSGGKDSTYALHWAVLKGFKISNLLTFQPRREDSWMFHRPGVEVTKLQAVAIGFPLYYAYTSGVKDKELEDLKNSLMEVKRKFG